MSNKKWGLSIKTIKTLFQLLIRSLLDYTSIISPLFSKTRLDMLEKIQFCCLKIILKKSKFESNNLLKETYGYESIEDRFNILNTKYLRKCLLNNNEIITEL